MGLFQKFFVDVRRGTKITYSESDLRKLDRNYEKEVLPKEPRKIRSPFRKVPQQAYLTQIRDYAFEKILDQHMYTFQHILVIPNPYDVVKQSALLLFNSSKETKIRYRVIGDTPEADFVGETEYTMRHRVPIIGLYLARSNQVELEMLDREGKIVKRRMLRIYVSDTPAKIKDLKVKNLDKNLSYFSFILLSGVSYNPFAIDCNGAVRYSIQLRTTNVGMFPLANGHFLYEDRTANRLAESGRIKSCRYHEMDYLGRVYRTFLLDFSIINVVAQADASLFFRASFGSEGKGRKLLELKLESGEVVEWSKLPKIAKESSAEQSFCYIDMKRKSRKGAAKDSENGIFSQDRKRMLSCVDLRKEKRAELVEIDTETGNVSCRRALNKIVNKVWLFEPDILSYCKPVEVTAEVVYGSVAPPEEFNGQIPPEADEPIDRAYFGNVRLCDDLFISYILPGRVSRIYLVGKKHVYVQEYSGMRIVGKNKFPFVISLTGLAIDEYHILVESQNVVHRLKNEIRIIE